ncbi:hypothetical protein N7535_004487 [Penicillium sp. DV-2018c]|nr:hypothetical protein N7535_004487 [Penicillium sp. DV-2018c]
MTSVTSESTPRLDISLTQTTVHGGPMTLEDTANTAIYSTQNENLGTFEQFRRAVNGVVVATSALGTEVDFRISVASTTTL